LFTFAVNGAFTVLGHTLARADRWRALAWDGPMAQQHNPAAGRNLGGGIASRLLAKVGRGLLLFYWLTCTAIIVMGLNSAYPAAGRKIAWAFEDPALALTEPFTNCAQAHYAGFFNIPRGSQAYLEGQDGDGDGLACEPYRDYAPDPLARVRLIEARLSGP
jgi:hypothetical protein